MRAITCTQCGATIDDVSENSVIIRCDHCGARIMIDRVPKSPAASYDLPDFDAGPSTIPSAKVLTFVGVAIVLIPLFVGALILNKPKTPAPQRVYPVASSPAPYPTPSSWSVTTEPEKPAAIVNYQPRVSWDGPNDLEHFEDPVVDTSSVSDLTTEELKKTVFKDRIVKLRVIINTEGEIDSVETISGHPLLVAAATDSAKSSIFHSRSKPTTRVLTYTFRVLKD